MEDQRLAVHRSIVVVDVEGFGDQRRTSVHRLAVRDGLYRVMRQAFGQAGISWDDCDREDRGDGVFVLVPAEVPKDLLAESLPSALVAGLQGYNGTHPGPERIRLRMALHAGEVRYDQHGVTGMSVNLAFRLLEAGPLKQALARSPGVLAVIASSWFFEEVVRDSEAAAGYRPVEVVVKETDATGWICLPDQASRTGRVTQSLLPTVVATAQSPLLEFGGLLRQLRMDAGLTQEDLSEAAGVSARTISDLERGLTRSPRRQTIRILADALQLGSAARDAFEAVARGYAPAVHAPGADRMGWWSGGGESVTSPAESSPVTEAVSTVNRPAPLFFLSYARSYGGHGRSSRGGERERWVRRFFDDLSENVAGLVSSPAGVDPGFMEQPARRGADWTAELLRAVSTCRVFVALLSIPYATDKWCAMEWDAFSRRMVVTQHGNESQNAIIPVTWLPFPEERIPAAIRSLPRFSPKAMPSSDLVADYEHYGIYGLMRSGREASYEGIVWRLAQQIAELHFSLSAEPRKLRPDEIRNIFAERRQ